MLRPKGLLQKLAEQAGALKPFEIGLNLDRIEHQ